MAMHRTILAAGFALALGAGAYAQDAETPAQTEAEADVVSVAEQDGELGTFIEAVEAAGLSDALRGDGPFTVFAPTDSAFEALPDGAMEELFDPANSEQLAAMLAYHVLPGKVTTSELEGQRGLARTAAGAEALIDASSDDIRINQAVVTKPDLDASNGIVHAIDAVVLPLQQPEGEGAEPEAAPEGEMPEPTPQ